MPLRMVSTTPEPCRCGVKAGRATPGSSCHTRGQRCQCTSLLHQALHPPHDPHPTRTTQQGPVHPHPKPNWTPSPTAAPSAPRAQELKHDSHQYGLPNRQSLGANGWAKGVCYILQAGTCGEGQSALVGTQLRDLFAYGGAGLMKASEVPSFPWCRQVCVHGVRHRLAPPQHLAARTFVLCLRWRRGHSPPRLRGRRPPRKLQTGEAGGCSTSTADAVGGRGSLWPPVGHGRRANKPCAARAARPASSPRLTPSHAREFSHREMQRRKRTSEERATLATGRHLPAGSRTCCLLAMVAEQRCRGTADGGISLEVAACWCCQAGGGVRSADAAAMRPPARAGNPIPTCAISGASALKSVSIS